MTSILGLKFRNFTVNCVESATMVKEASQDDIIILDYHGTDSRSLQNPNEAVVILVSGDSDVNPDLTKPYRPKDLYDLINEKISDKQNLEKNAA